MRFISLGIRRYLLLMLLVPLSWITGFTQNELRFEELFDDNSKSWDLYTSDKSKASLKYNKLCIQSKNDVGTSRFVEVGLPFKEFTISCDFERASSANNTPAGLIFNYQNWDNFSYYIITDRYLNIGFYENGQHSAMTQNQYSQDIQSEGPNGLRINTKGDFIVFSINDVVQYKMKRFPINHKNVGAVILGKTGEVCFDNLVVVENDPNAKNVLPGVSSQQSVKSSGSGFFVSSMGHILTNYHVVENQKEVAVDLYRDGKLVTYTAIVDKVDANNDLAILKIKDPSFSCGTLPYSIKDGVLEVGTSVFTLGFPLYLAGLGNEPKFTDGRVSSKSGFNNAVNAYQTSIAVQPGNSGSPVFNLNGELSGVVNARIINADNVSYAIKASYAKILIDELNSSKDFVNTLKGQPLEDQLKTLNNYVVLIKVY